MKKALWPMSFSSRILRNMLAVSLLTILLLSGIYFYQQVEMALSYTRTDIRQTMARASEKLNQAFQEVKDLYGDLMRDGDLFRFFTTYDASKISPAAANRALSDVLNTYLLHADGVFQVQFLRSDVVVYNRNATYTSIYNLENAPFYQKAREAGEYPFWVSTYDFTEAFGHTSLRDAPVANRYLISLVGELNLYQLRDGRLTYLPEAVEKPVLVISMLESYLREALSDSTPYEGAQYLIVDAAGAVVSHIDENRRMTQLDAAQTGLLQGAEGEVQGVYEGERCLVCYQSLLTGWKIVSVVPESSIMSAALSNIAATFVAVSLLALLLCLLLSVSLSRAMARPIHRLMLAIDQTSHGDFNVQLPATRDEFNVLMGAFNDMAVKIDSLIEENYNVRLREKENELLALRYQTNPHFLYNALNILHMSALRGEDDKTAGLIILLSKMMRYVLRDGRDVVPLREELENVRQYFSLMQVAYEDNIRLEIEAPEETQQAQLPKLSLQPLVENAVQHGLAGRSGGVVRIKAQKAGGLICITISDNGRGVPEDYTIPRKESENGSIGVANVQKRLSLIFGEKSELRITRCEEAEGGTDVLIVLPFRRYVSDDEQIRL